MLKKTFFFFFFSANVLTMAQCTDNRITVPCIFILYFSEFPKISVVNFYFCRYKISHLKRNFLGALPRHIPESHGVNSGTTGQGTSSNGERGSEFKGVEGDFNEQGSLRVTAGLG